MGTAKKELLKQGFIYYILTTLSVGIQFALYLVNSPQIDNMDFAGMVYYVAAAISHAALFALIPFLALFLPVAAITGNEKIANTLHIIGSCLLNIVVCINAYVYALYKFHINGIVLSLFFGEGGSEIISFDIAVYVKSAGIILLFIVGNLLLRLLATFLSKKLKRIYLPSITALVVLLAFSNLFHAYAAVAQKQSVIRSSPLLPYYFPLTANRLMIKLGVISPDDLVKADFGSQKAEGITYPLKPIECDSVGLKNIVVIAIDSWNYRAYTPEVMPRITAFAEKNASTFTNHLSSSNGTRGSIFGLFFSTSSYYWNDFDVLGVSPVIIDELLAKGYNIKTFPSATLHNPNFAKLIFYKVKGIQANTAGESTYDRDVQLTKDFVNFLESDSCKQQPFFSFLFYDLTHSQEYPRHLAKKFTPSWEYPDYMQLNNDMDPTPFWNLYLNCASAVDSLIGMVTDKLVEKGLLENTIIVITGDHGQEFNENHKNYWGHGSNYTYPQIHVPFIYYEPDKEKKTYTHRTTHYDVAPTLLHEAMGVRNNPSEYSMGSYLTDTTFRNWHIVGDNLNYAFIVEDNVIIEKKPSGSLDIFDAQLNLKEDYKPNAKQMNEAIKKLNMFYTK